MTEINTKSQSDCEIVVAELDPDFKFEIANEPGGENILFCFQCGTCVAVCPVAAKNPEYDPKKIIWMALLGLREKVLSSKAIWLCSTCYSCYIRCPQNVKITSVMSAIQNIATREGHVHSSYEAGLKMLEETGRTVELSEFENQKREKLNCPPIVENAESTKKILNVTRKLKEKIKDKSQGDEK
ncbi:MAG: 4Fe-4S dicluster domain-containing protein [Methanomassiliicoccales archaeon]|nr:MAG: 4Fe-4S dicluster domain-containing protein [Methanomassiliicoccales archaeon]